MQEVTVKVEVDGWSRRVDVTLSSPKSVAAFRDALKKTTGKTVGDETARDLRELLHDVLRYGRQEARERKERADRVFEEIDSVYNSNPENG